MEYWFIELLLNRILINYFLFFKNCVILFFFVYDIFCFIFMVNKYGLMNIFIVFFVLYLYKNCFKNNYELFFEFFIYCKINEFFWYVCILFFYKF